MPTSTINNGNNGRPAMHPVYRWLSGVFGGVGLIANLGWIVYLGYRVSLAVQHKAPSQISPTETGLLLAAAFFGFGMTTYPVYLAGKQDQPQGRYSYISPEWRAAAGSLGYGVLALLVAMTVQVLFLSRLPNAANLAANVPMLNLQVSIAAGSMLVLLVLVFLYGRPHNLQQAVVGTAMMMVLSLVIQAADYYLYRMAGGPLALLHDRHPELIPYYPALDNLAGLLTVTVGIMLIYQFVRRPAIIAAAAKSQSQEDKAEALLQRALLGEARITYLGQQQAVELQEQARLHGVAMKNKDTAHTHTVKRLEGEHSVRERLQQHTHADQMAALQQQGAQELAAARAKTEVAERKGQQLAAANSKLQSERDAARNLVATHEATIKRQQGNIQTAERSQAAVERAMRAMVAMAMDEVRAALLKPPAPVAAQPDGGQSATVASQLIAEWAGKDTLQLWMVNNQQEWRIVSNGTARPATPKQAPVFAILYDLEGATISRPQLAVAVKALGHDIGSDAIRQTLDRFTERGVLIGRADGLFSLPLPPDRAADNPPTTPLQA